MDAKRFRYAVKLTPAEEGGFVVTCRDLPTFITQGDTKEEALTEAVDAMDEVFYTYNKHGKPLPEPSNIKAGEEWVSPPAETIAKAAKYLTKVLQLYQEASDAQN